jgi:valyl-tRNA synthetase
VTAGDDGWAVIEASLAKLLRMAGASEIARREIVEGAPAAVTPLGTLHLDLASAVDPAAEKKRLARELEKIDAHVRGTEARLANPAFAGKAPPAVIEGARRQLAELQARRCETERLLHAIR